MMMAGSGQKQPPSFVPGGDGCSSVSGRQKSDFQKNSAAIDKNDRVGGPLVRYFERGRYLGTPIFPIPAAQIFSVT
jgi:hypothetical protein